ncbi:uncharacterized protein LOC108218072 [Daucus carota subsp. sativus]|uniref:uncharacterized protein LOC108218072 n=1 Tax=Daucus carota subsp. sativus TaxID=79200 RepID=UPI00308273A9
MDFASLWNPELLDMNDPKNRRPYRLVVYYGGGFMTLAEYNYCGKFKKVWNNVDFLAMTIKEIRAKASEVVGDEDTIYYMKDGVTPDKGYESLIYDEEIERVARVSRFTGVEGYELEDVGGVYPTSADMKNKKFTARKRYLSKTQDKGKGKSVVLEEDGDNDDDYVAEMDEQEDETDDDSGYVEEEDEEEWPCSDTELADMRRMRAQLREENDALEKSQSQARRDSLKGLSGQRNDSSLLKEPIYNNELEEEEDYAYAEPAVAQKHKAGAHEVFNRRRCNSSTTNDEKTEGEAQKTKEKGRLGRCS